MKIKPLILTCLLTATTCACAAVQKEFPKHWGEPPRIQTRDYVELPGDYGHGSSTLANWIRANLEKDANKDAPAEAAKPVYQNDFETAEPGILPAGFLALQGDFAVAQDGTNRVLELPGAPLDSHAVLFGPVVSSNVVVNARIHGTATGRRLPTFGVGLGGVAGYKLQVSPAKEAIELFRDMELLASAPFKWASDKWVHLQLQVRSEGESKWKVEGFVWKSGFVRPEMWRVTYEDTRTPVPGQASVIGSPFSGTPIRYDDLKVELIGK